jgi:hypothetical protein
MKGFHEAAVGSEFVNQAAIGVVPLWARPAGSYDVVVAVAGARVTLGGDTFIQFERLPRGGSGYEEAVIVRRKPVEQRTLAGISRRKYKRNRLVLLIAEVYLPEAGDLVQRVEAAPGGHHGPNPAASGKLI